MWSPREILNLDEKGVSCMNKDKEQERHELDEPTIEIPVSLFIALLTGEVQVEMKSISLGEYLEKEKVN